MQKKPEILAPAGDVRSMLAAYAAGADAVYLGLKHFSARMEADNFALPVLARLVEVAHSQGRRVYVALNSLFKPADLSSAGRLIAKLERDVKPDSLICQDLGAVELAKQAGFQGEVYLSTLANLTHAKAMEAAADLGVNRVILPRELDLNEVRSLSKACPDSLSFEIFIHGALCYCVSGRCYWSSYMGGKSGLRGRCVQPCRRVYGQKGKTARFFSCRDLATDTMVKELMSIPKVVSWKIEGRKKGPHYVYHVVKAYRLLRDNPSDQKAVKEASGLLAHALGRPRTKAMYLPTQPQAPAQPGAHTSSGLFVGQVEKLGRKGKSPAFALKPRVKLFPGDFLRVGNEDEPWHFTHRVTDKTFSGKYALLTVTGSRAPKPGTPVFLIDRRDPEIKKKIKEWENKLEQCHAPEQKGINFKVQMPAPAAPGKPGGMLLARNLSRPRRGGQKGAPVGNITALWLNPGVARTTPKALYGRLFWWLPPVIWPDEEQAWQELITFTLRKGGKRFVLGSPWQIKFFNDAQVELIAGPFCNASNAAALQVLKNMGFKRAVVSPELSGKDMLSLVRQSPLPLGVVIKGYWPMGISRFPVEGIKAAEPFTSPKNEVFWSKKYGENNWIYPGWSLDISQYSDELQRAGYELFITMNESLPRNLPQETRSSEFNWNLTLL
ncbi:peptidase U32 family protein [Dethiosulfatarculus sandiegensis]|uniref:Peptidase U32 n=1 Tax=Dethiosulfatarculus sandiegensis TaxID=1429043 RepID=A0A0D2GLT0_9BACT|nr:peptidase U32 family protein [Dethiosulfatarculus sandiegensis]KIX15647.1 peptidase U32 [Dethiosulfatarculus sandiegensis]